MTLAPGTRLGPYEILSALGAGGMGEVYRASDARLGRTVAIKVLPTEVASDPDRRARFDREARVISSLNHPHICTLHDVGREAGTDFLVMEFVEGETLAQRLRTGPLPLGDVLRHGEMLAGALFAAHRQGIVHRDLKPGNIMLTRSGLKLLDFGIAKLRVDAAASDTLGRAAAPTEASPVTGAGVLLGTFQYMAPEQVEGKEADARSDLWALGCVLYEMATGKRPFEGPTPAALAAAILTQEPAMAALQPSAPPAFERLLRRCLARDPDARWQNAGDLAFELRAIGSESTGQSDGRRVTSDPPRRSRAAWAVAAVACLVALAGVIWGTTRSGSPALPPVTRFTIRLPIGERLNAATVPALALSPDGTLLAYAAQRGGTVRLYLRRMDQLAPEPIPGTEGASAPFFSPDGRTIAFFAERKLKKVATAGGAVTTLADAPDPWGATWLSDDTIVFNRHGFQGLWQVAASGGEVRELTKTNAATGEWEHEWPHALPGGRGVLFSAMSAAVFDTARIKALSRETLRQTTLVEGGFSPRYLPTGHLLYARRRGLFAVPFDLDGLVTTGAAVRVLDDVLTSLTGAVQAAVAGNGTLAYVPGSPDRRAMRVARSGGITTMLDTRGAYADLSLSPDGTRLALTIEGDKSFDIWIADLARGALAPLTSIGGLTGFPTWSPDGKHIAFLSSPVGETNKVYWQPSDGSGPAERLTSGDHIQWPSAFSPDGRFLLYGDFDPATSSDVWVLPLEGERKPRPILRTPFNEDQAVFSPDGRYLAYVSDQSGREEVHVVGADGLGAKWQVSVEGGREPRWVNGEILYRNGDRMMSAAVRTRPAFSADKPRVLFESNVESCTLPGCRSFDVSADGRDVVLLTSEHGPPTEIHVVVGWFRELESAMAAADTRRQ